MELQGMKGKIGFQEGSYFIGKKCQKFLVSVQPMQNTVSIVPIIGEYKGLSAIESTGLGRNIRYIEVF